MTKNKIIWTPFIIFPAFIFSWVCRIYFGDLLPLIITIICAILIVETLYQAQMLPVFFLRLLKPLHDSRYLINDALKVSPDVPVAAPESNKKKDSSKSDIKDAQKKFTANLMKNDSQKELVSTADSLIESKKVLKQEYDKGESGEQPDQNAPVTQEAPEQTDWIAELEENYGLKIDVLEKDSGNIFEVDEEIIANIKAAFAERNTKLFDKAVVYVEDGSVTGAFPFSRSCRRHWIVRGCHEFQTIPTPCFKV
nr:hypothetical protein [uncultured Desulfobacter sp.]